MKKKNILMLFIVLWFSLTTTNKIAAEKMVMSKTLPIKTKMQTIEEEEQQEEKRLTFEKENLEKTKKKFHKLITNLNRLKVYALVTTTLDEKNEEQDVLLSIIPESRIDNEQQVIDYRYHKVIFTRNCATRRRTVSKKNRFSIINIVKSNQFSGISKIYRDGKHYSVENGFGYKSICLLFFDKFTAENFLIKSANRTGIILQNIPKESNEEILNGLLRTNLKAVPLGDLFAYLTMTENRHLFENFEFLFVPYVSKINSMSSMERRKFNKLIRRKSFSFYQKKFLEFQKTIEDTDKTDETDETDET
jgi:hypothetical protein